MAKLTFFSILKSDLKCFLCKRKYCPVRYMPNRKMIQHYEGIRYCVIECKKDKKAREEAI